MDCTYKFMCTVQLKRGIDSLEPHPYPVSCILCTQDGNFGDLQDNGFLYHSEVQATGFVSTTATIFILGHVHTIINTHVLSLLLPVGGEEAVIVANSIHSLLYFSGWLSMVIGNRSGL